VCVLVSVLSSCEESANSVLYCNALFVSVELIMLCRTTCVSENLSMNTSCAGL